MKKIAIIRSLPIDLFNSTIPPITREYQDHLLVLIVQENAVEQIDIHMFAEHIIIPPGPISVHTLPDSIITRLKNHGFHQLIIPCKHLLFKDYTNLLALAGFLHIPEVMLWQNQDRVKILRPSPAFYLDDQAEHFLKMKQITDAEAGFLKSIQADETSVRSRIGIGFLYFQKKQIEKANNFFVHAFSLQAADSLEWLVNLLLFLFDTQQAEYQLTDIFQFLKPHLDIEIGRLYFDRLGHLAENTDIYLRRRQLQMKEKTNPFSKTTIFLSGKPENRQLLTMIKRQIHVLENPAMLGVFHDMKKSFPGANDPYFLPVNCNEYLEFSQANVSLTFSPAEDERGKEFLKKMGIPCHARFVCIYGRDPRYLKEKYPTLDTSYQDIWRNMDIDTFRPAVAYLLDQGFYVIRMGKDVSQPFIYNDNHVIDYALHYRSDFMDIYLPARCYFFIGSTGGLSIIPHVFDVPLLGVNIVPIGFKPRGKHDLYIPKKAKNRFTGEYIPFSVMLKKLSVKDTQFLNGLYHYELGYMYEDNTGEEILVAVQEMLQFLERIHQGKERPPDEIKLLDHYFQLYPPHHWNKQNKTPIAISFLKKYPHLFT